MRASRACRNYIVLKLFTSSHDESVEIATALKLHEAMCFEKVEIAKRLKLYLLLAFQNVEITNVSKLHCYFFDRALRAPLKLQYRIFF